MLRRRPPWPTFTNEHCRQTWQRYPSSPLDKHRHVDRREMLGRLDDIPAELHDGEHIRRLGYDRAGEPGEPDEGGG